MRKKWSKSWDVLVVEAGNSTVGRQIKRSLERHDLKVGGIEHVRKLNERDFIKEIRNKAQNCGAKMIIPVFYPEVLARHRDEFPGIIVPVDSAQKIELLDNKVTACAIAEKLGIRQPVRYEDADSVEKYPVVFKRSSGHGGDSVYFPKFRKALENLVSTSRPGTYLITEEIDGDDVCVDAIRWEGFFFAAAYRVILPKAKGISVLRESIDAPELVAAAGKMLEEVDYCGVCGFDFRLSPDGKAYFLECNPRFSGGLCSQTASGFDMPWILWQLSNGITPDYPVFKTGVRTQYIKGTIDYLRRRYRQGKLKARDVLQCIFSGAFHFD